MQYVRRTLYFCNGAPCTLGHCRELALRVAQALGIGMNERTSDGLLAIRSMRCREHPDALPILMVDDDCYEIADWSDLDSILDELRSSLENLV